MREKILKAIELYVNEPQDESKMYEIRSIPDPEVLVGFIMSALMNR